jgi:hypothetical protein
MNNPDSRTLPEKSSRVLFGASALVHAPILAAALFLFAISGCGLIPVTQQEPEVKAEYTLTKSPLLVLINDDLGGRGSPSVRAALHVQLAKELDENKANQQVIADKDMREFLAREGFGRGMDELRLAKAMKARQILRIQLEPYSGALGGADIVAEAQVTCIVHVIDVETGDQKYPVESRGQKVTYKMPVSDIHSTSPGPAMQAQLGKGLAHLVARLFYTYRLTPMENLRHDAPSLEGF